MKVFVSYSTVDQELAKKIGAILANLDIEYFFDQKDINWGESIRDRIHSGLRDSLYVVIILSPASIESQWVAYETGFADGHQKRLLPFLQHPSIKVPGFLQHLHHETQIEDIRSFFLQEKSKQAQEDANLLRALQSGKWRLIFNPPDRGKEISFEANGEIGKGRNHNERSWKIIGGKLVIFSVDGKCQSQFEYNPLNNRLFHTNDGDTQSIRGQIIEPLT